MKKDSEERAFEKSEMKQELDRYKDLLSLREKEINQLKTKDTAFKKSEEVWKKKIAQLEGEKKEMSQLLMKV
jgi:hypothetical protein